MVSARLMNSLRFESGLIAHTRSGMHLPKLCRTINDNNDDN